MDFLANEKIGWSRIGETVSGRMFVLCDLPVGYCGIKRNITVYSKKTINNPTPSRMVLTEKTIPIKNMARELIRNLIDDIFFDDIAECFEKTMNNLSYKIRDGRVV